MDILTNDVKKQYDRSFATLRAIIEAFPEDKWLAEHGDEYYIPSRIAYHLAVFIDGFVAEGMKNDPDFRDNRPFGSWKDGTAATLPGKAALLGYYDESVARAEAILDKLDDAAVVAAIEPERARMGESNLGAHMYVMREIADHTGELNKMLIENGIDDIWM